MEKRVGGVGSAIKYIGIGLFALICWLQYNTSFETAASTLLAIAIFIGVLVGAILVLVAFRSGQEGIIHYEEARSRVEVEKFKMMRTDQKSIAQQVTQQTRWLLAQSAPYWKAKYQLDARPVEQEQVAAEYRPLEYDDDEL